MFFGRKQEITHAETTVQARAKINLTLDVTGRREDGYHTVQMVMQSVALHDTIRVAVTQGERKPRGILLTCNLPYLPVDERNLAYRAAELFYQETDALPGTCEIHIEKRIPMAAGLAGGSSDAAAVLRALAALHNVCLTDDELCAMGLKLGADVPYCLRGGTMLAEGIGEELTALSPMPHCWVVLCKPPFAVSTKDAYREMDEVSIRQRPDTKGMIRALEKGDYHGVASRLSNVMELVTAISGNSRCRLSSASRRQSISRKNIWIFWSGRFSRRIKARKFSTGFRSSFTIRFTLGSEMNWSILA